MSNIIKSFTGFCKLQNKDYTLRPNYVEARTLNNTVKCTYQINPKFKCEYALKNNGCVYAENGQCELSKIIPETIEE